VIDVACRHNHARMAFVRIDAKHVY
jgi:hypothetical protein